MSDDVGAVDYESEMRHVTKDWAVFYFEVDDAEDLLRVLAVFFGRQDHRRRMLLRLLARDAGARRTGDGRQCPPRASRSK